MIVTDDGIATGSTMIAALKTAKAHNLRGKMNTIRSILFATDFSAQSETAFPLAVALARDYGAHLLIAHVMQPPIVAYTPGELGEFEPGGTPDEIKERLKEFDPQDSRIKVEYRVVQGEAASEILRMAKESQCDMVVIGTHGRTGISRVLLGSVAEEILRHAPCPVLTIRCPAPAEQT